MFGRYLVGPALGLKEKTVNGTAFGEGLRARRPDVDGTRCADEIREYPAPDEICVYETFLAQTAFPAL